jgi:hypothetical protein
VAALPHAFTVAALSVAALVRGWIALLPAALPARAVAAAGSGGQRWDLRTAGFICGLTNRDPTWPLA